MAGLRTSRPTIRERKSENWPLAGLPKGSWPECWESPSRRCESTTGKNWTSRSNGPNALVGKALFDKALGDGPGSITAAIFWLKCRANWKTQDGGGQPIVIHVDPRASLL